jgi:vacuolar protein sorting-associated protein 13A/C
VGDSLPICLDLARSCPNSTPYHFLDKIDISFLVEILIFPRFLNLAKLRVSGGIPILKLNISDMKYKTLMSILDVTLRSIDDNSLEVPSSKEVSSVLPEKIEDNDYVIDVDSVQDISLRTGTKSVSCKYLIYAHNPQAFLCRNR